ncbi:MAG: nucleotidyltransferase domain-containing protein [Bacteroidales bacterium]|nr:nucleotidyltransferase domain-containing protein [Bacteroidales bacterium]
MLFGSRAKGNYNRGSDIDLTIKGDNLTLNDVLDLSIDLDDLMLPYKFDLIIYDRIKEKDLIDHILRVGIPLLKRGRNNLKIVDFLFLWLLYI